MFRLFTGICLLFVVSGLLFADQVRLKNGDTITGSIVKKDGDKLTFKSDVFGEVAIPWSAIVDLKSTGPVYVQVPGGGQVSGTVATTGSNLEITSAGTTRTTPLAEVPAIRNEEQEKAYERMLAPGWLDLWAGYFDLGYALARGNAKTNTFTTAFNAIRATNNDKTKLYYTQVYATATVTDTNGNRTAAATAKAVRGGWSYDHNVSSRVFVNVFNDYEYDRFQNLDLRYVVGGGAGFHAIKSEKTVLDLLGGLDYDHDSFSNNLSRNSGELFWGNDLAYKLSGKTSMTQSFRMFDNLTNTGEYRINFDLGANTVLKKWLSWQVTASDRFLSNPVFGRQRNDILLTTGLRVSFAR